MKIGIIKERKSPPDKRVALTPESCRRLMKKYPELTIVAESSDIRIFADEDYRNAGIGVVDDVSDCDVLIGVKEVPIEALIPGRKYFFFSHTIKEQPFNRDLLRAILDQKIDLYDHETLTDESGRQRLVAFGRYAGLVGAYNGLRAYGLKTGLYDLPTAVDLGSSDRMKEVLLAVKWPAIRIVLTGTGRVGTGAREILDCLPFEQLPVEDYLNHRGWNGVYCHIDVLDYNRKSGGGGASKEEYFADPSGYESDFFRFAAVSDLYIAAHFYQNGSPQILTAEELRRPERKIRVIADISCDIGEPIASTLRASTIEDPLYGYLPETGEEVAFDHPDSVGVMAVDNLPCEIPAEASEGFAHAFEQHIIPAFFDGDSRDILQRAQITHKGSLTEGYAYLRNYVGE